MGLLQKTLGNDEGHSSDSLQDMKVKFSALKSQTISKATEYVGMNLNLIVGCGCGGSSGPIHVAIPNDSKASEVKAFIKSTATSRGTIDEDEMNSIKERYPNVVFNYKHIDVDDMAHYNKSNYREVF